MFHWNTAFIVSLGKSRKVNTLLCILLPSLQTTLLTKINNKAMFIFLVIKSLKAIRVRYSLLPSTPHKEISACHQLTRYLKNQDKLKRKS